MLTENEREWVSAGMAWVALRRWVAGADAGDAARLWFQDQMDVRFDAKHAVRMMGDGMASLEAETAGRVLDGMIPICGLTRSTSRAVAAASMPTLPAPWQWKRPPEQPLLP